MLCVVLNVRQKECFLAGQRSISYTKSRWRYSRTCTRRSWLGATGCPGSLRRWIPSPCRARWVISDHMIFLFKQNNLRVKQNMTMQLFFAEGIVTFVTNPGSNCMDPGKIYKLRKILAWNKEGRNTLFKTVLLPLFKHTKILLFC